MNRLDVELHIEELVLNGFSPADRHHISEAFQRELHRLMGERAGELMQRTDRNLDTLPAPSFAFAAHTPPRIAGRTAARQLFEALSAQTQP